MSQRHIQWLHEELPTLVSKGVLTTEAAEGVRFLLETQAADGTWEEDDFTATGFPKHFMIKYHNYRNCFPCMALGRFLSAVQTAISPSNTPEKG